MNSTLVSTLVLVAAAALEVAGDAVIREGLHGLGLVFVVLGIAMLGATASS